MVVDTHKDAKGKVPRPVPQLNLKSLNLNAAAPSSSRKQPAMKDSARGISPSGPLSKSQKTSPTSTADVSRPRNESNHHYSSSLHNSVVATPRGSASYRDALITPRGTNYRPVPNSARVPTKHDDALSRASVEQHHVKQQISKLDAAIKSQQAALIENIALVQSLGAERDKLAAEATRLQAAVSSSQAIIAARQSDNQELELLIESLQATLNACNIEEMNNLHPRTSALQKTVMSLMQLAARTMALSPAFTHAIEVETHRINSNTSGTHNPQQRLSSSRTTTTTAALLTGRSEQSTSRYLSPAASFRRHDEAEGPLEEEEEKEEEKEEDEEDNRSSIVDESDDEDEDDDSDQESLESCATGISTADIPHQPHRRQHHHNTTKLQSSNATGGNEVVDNTNTNTGDGGGKLHRPAFVMPPLNLSGSIPALRTHQPRQQHQQQQVVMNNDVVPENNNNNNTSHATAMHSPSHPSPAAIARLQSIKSKLEIAEAILTARVIDD